MSVLRVRLDPVPGFTLFGCAECPLSYRDHECDLRFCAAADDEHGTPRVVRDFGPAPSWCPLRTGPVTVEGVP